MATTVSVKLTHASHYRVWLSISISSNPLSFFFAGVKRRATLCESAFYECYAQVHPSISNSIPLCRCQCRVPYFRFTCQPTRTEDRCSYGSSLGHHAMLGLYHKSLLELYWSPPSVVCCWKTRTSRLCRSVSVNRLTCYFKLRFERVFGNSIFVGEVRLLYALFL